MTPYHGENLETNVSTKNRAFARSTGVGGSRGFVDAERSAMNSRRTYDSASLVDSTDGWSGGVSGPPYAIAGTWDLIISIGPRGVSNHKRRTLLAGLTLEAYHSGLF